MSILNLQTEFFAAAHGSIGVGELVVDNFAGGGGASTGIAQAIGRSVDIAINHDLEAIKLHQLNHPDTKHYCENILDIDPMAVCGERPVGMAWFSPDCTHHSKAKGGKPRKKKLRALAWIVLRWAGRVRPRVIFLENVEEFQDWGPLKKGKPIKARKSETFKRWVKQLKALGYNVEWRVLAACDYGAPTTRKRLFLVARCDGAAITWPTATHGKAKGLKAYRTAGECIDFDIPCPSIFARKKPLVEKTMARIAKGLKRYVVDCADPFIITYYTQKTFRGQSINEPLRTQTTENRFGLVTPYVVGIDNQSSGPGATWPTTEPVRTITTENRFALVSAFIAKHYTGVVGHGVDRLLGTITTIDHHSLVLARLATTGDKGKERRAEVRAFLIKYYGCGAGQGVDEPLHTITTKERFGLVTVQGVDYQIVDIGLRMLQPKELAKAQGMPEGYIFQGTKTRQVRMIGNSVSPPPARALVAGNYKEAVAGMENIYATG
jgi:DNA (cytosine-5)-methyltransferase 1